jgi:hypothetical protein
MTTKPQSNPDQPPSPGGGRISLTITCQFHPHKTMSSRMKTRADMVTSANGRKSPFQKVLPNRIRFSDELTA